MTHDDSGIGHLLNRREVLALLGASGAAAIFGCHSGVESFPAAAIGAPGCIVTPAQTAGPFFVDEELNRSDIRSDSHSGAVKNGIPLALTLQVMRVADGICAPLSGARVDVWHCDARGIYSDVEKTSGQNFLRGYQVSDATGAVKFSTIYPGWYDFRTVHIHFKIRTPTNGAAAHEFVSQLYFDDALSDAVYSRAPYVSQGPRKLRNADDGVFAQGGPQLLLAPVATATGYEAKFAVGMQLV